MQKNKFLIFLIPLFFVISSFSQDKEYALDCVKTLASPEFHGRGFVKNGDKKASLFIANELKKWKTLNFNNSYYQNFTFNINTLSKVKVSIDNKDLILGVDFLVYAASSSTKGTYHLYYPENFAIDQFKKENHKDDVFVLDTIHYKSKELIANYKKIIRSCALSNAKAIIEITNNRLIQTQSIYEFGFSYLQIKNESWDSTAEEIHLNIKNNFKKDYTTRNVIAYIEGEVDSFYVFTAHYDHLGQIGKDVYFPGANDNASGVATILNLAKYYKEKNTKPHYSIAFMLFTAEEAGLIGSLYYTKHPLFPLEKIKFLFNLDMVGTGQEGLSVVNGKKLTNASKLLKTINNKNNYFDDIRIGKEAANSDHHFFDKAGVSSVFLFTRGDPQFYHDIYDQSKTLEMNKLNELTKILTKFTEQYQIQ